LKRKYSSTENDEFPDSIEINEIFDAENVDPSMKATPRGITIDCNEEYENAEDSIRLSCEWDSNETEKSDSQREKHDGHRISTLHGTMTDEDEPK
jgi:hypothetical protein